MPQAPDLQALRAAGRIAGEARREDRQALEPDEGLFLAVALSVMASAWLGLVLAEAMACGTPVAAMDCGATPEIIEMRCATRVSAYSCSVQRGSVGEVRAR